MKTCTQCKEEKDESEFPKKRNGLASYCLECLRQYSREHYRLNKRKYLKRNGVRRQKIKEYIQQQKSVPCLDCGVSYPHYVMDFDHLGDKVDNVSWIANHGSWKQLKAEIAKCEVVCSNCHRKRTFKET